MSLFKRFLYYMGGFAIGLIILFFFLGGKRASCDYGPNARTLKNIRTKERAFSETALAFFQKEGIDTANIKNLLTSGNVIFSESNTSLDSCKVYIIEGRGETKPLKITVKNCEKEATITHATFN